LQPPLSRVAAAYVLWEQIARWEETFGIAVSAACGGLGRRQFQTAAPGEGPRAYNDEASA